MTRLDTFMQVGDSQLGYEQAGQGPDVLFLHGWPLHRKTWRNVATAMPDVTTHLVDFPGCGTSVTPAATAVSMRNHVDVAVKVIEQIATDEKQVVVVGQDSRGMIARLAIAQVPELVSALIITGTEIPGHHPELIDQLQKLTKLPGASRVTRLALGSARIARNKRMLGGLFSDTDLIEGEFRTEVLDPLVRSAERMDRQLEILAGYTHDLVDELATAHGLITCPTLIVWGDRDPFFPPGLARKMVEQFAGPTTFEVIPKARLLAYEEHPEQFARLSMDFLREHGIRAQQATHAH